MKKILFLAILAFTGVQINAQVASAPSVNLESAADFGILAATDITSIGFGVISNGDVGISPAARAQITGFPPAIIVNGAIYASDDSAAVAAMLDQAKLDLNTAYLFAEGASAPAPATVAGDQGGLTLPPGIYKSNSTLLIQSGDLTLDAQGDPNAGWIFQIASDFTSIGGAGGNVILAGGAQAKNIIWQVGSSATIGNNTSFSGDILAYASITMNTGSSIDGRLLAMNGAVVLSGTNMINLPEASSTCDDADSFITTWKTTAPGETITIPTFLGETYSYTVDWGDGHIDTDVQGNITHPYTSAGTHTVKICGTFPRIYFNNYSGKFKIQSIEQWGPNNWSSMNAAFMGAQNLVSHATDMPDLSLVTDMYGMFAYARKFNGDANFGNWNVGNVTNMYGMFAGASVFNSPIGGWNVGNVTTMESMFFGATIFNQPLGNWNVSSVTTMRSMFQTAYGFNQSLNNWNVGNVTDMYGMFAYARKFNGEIGNWNVGNVTNMTGMFGGGSVFNKAIGNWNVSSVTNMEQMFHGATVFNQDLSTWNVGNVTTMRNMFATSMRFNQDIGNWNVGNVTNMYYMFFHANRFDQDLGSWNVSKVTNMTHMFVNVELSTANYDSLLNGWSTLPLKHNVKFHGGKSKYCAGEAGRNIMTGTPYNWIIQDGGMDCTPPLRLDVGDNVMLSGITLYPNPMGEQMNLVNPEGQKLESISIYDLSGRLIKTVDLREVSSEMTLDVSNLSKATYMVVISSETGSISKLMVKK